MRSFKVRVRTVYEDNAGTNDHAMPKDTSGDKIADANNAGDHEVALVDIVNDPVPDKHKDDCPVHVPILLKLLLPPTPPADICASSSSLKDLTKFKSEKTGRGPLNKETWMVSACILMVPLCSQPHQRPLP